MYGHTKMMKDLVELIETFGKVVDRQPVSYFRPVQLMANLFFGVASQAIIEEGVHILNLIEKQALKLAANMEPPARVYLGGWEMLVVVDYLKRRSVIKLDDIEMPIADAVDVLLTLNMAGGEIQVAQSDADTFIEVVTKRAP